MNHNGYGEWKKCMQIAYYMLEGNTAQEAAEEFGISDGYVNHLITNQIRVSTPRIYEKIKNKPYMVFQRIIYRKCSVEEACSKHRISRKKFDLFLEEILRLDFKTYVAMRTKIHNAQTACK